MLDYPLCWSVTRLQLLVSFSSENELALIPSLLNCFPKLQNLRISVRFLVQQIIEPPVTFTSYLDIKHQLKVTGGSLFLDYLRFIKKHNDFLFAFSGWIPMRAIQVPLLIGRDYFQQFHASKQVLLSLRYAIVAVMMLRTTWVMLFQHVHPNSRISRSSSTLHYCRYEV